MAAERASQSHRRAGGCRYRETRAGGSHHRQMARQTGVDRPPHPRDDRHPGGARRTNAGSGFRRAPTAGLRPQPPPLHQTGNPRIDRSLHPPRLRPVACEARRGSLGRRLEGRLLLSLPWFEIRLCRSGLPRGAGPHESRSSSASLSQRYPNHHRPGSGEGVMRSMLNGLLEWTDARFPVSKLWNEHLASYYAPKNFNFWYYFGSLALLVLVMQLATGIWLAMFYKPDAALAFGSVEYIMRDVEWGWLIRYMHSTGASAFFIIIYLHMFRALMYGSYKAPRELLWVIGMLIYLCLMAEAFFGYLLPWGQMSYWGAQVIISLFGALPFGIGEALALWIRGDYVVSDATLSRFYSLHIVGIPLLLLGLVAAHLIALHEVGSNNPEWAEIKKNKDAKGVPVDGLAFHPYYTVKDLWGAGVFLTLFLLVVFYAPEFGGWFLESANFVPANPLQTPEHILPVWYFTPYYAILRAIPDKLTGVIAMDLGLSAEQTAENLLFASDRITEPMNISMSPEKAAKWFGVAPPDLSLIARSRGADWLYSYLVTFYADPDPSRPFGVNNVIFGDVGMPHALQSLQGLQEYIAGDTPSEATNVQPVGLEIRADDIIVRKSATMPDGSHVEILDTLKVTQAGEMEPAIYRGAMRDLVNFLVYVGEPARLERNALGLWVVLFMLFFTLLLRTLYKEYWRDVH
eukprot:XP_019857384.1 PREDICTED: uncharacterized protein LOC109585702 [Amphimedon queenslandica]